MKQFLIFILLTMFCITTFGQTDTDSKSESKTVAFRDRSGSLMKEQVYNIGKFNRISYDAIIYTDLNENEVMGSLRVTTSDTRYLYYGYLDSDEIDAALKTLSYIQDNVLGSTPDTETKIEYNSRDKVRIGVSAGVSGNWTVYVYAHSYDKDTKMTFNSDDLPKMIEAIKKAQELINNKTTKL